VVAVAVMVLSSVGVMPAELLACGDWEYTKHSGYHGQ